MKFKLLLLVLITVPFLTACEDEDDRRLAEAEKCINTATAATVDSCIAKVAGMESADAYLIRCSAHFIAQDFTETRLVSAFKHIKESTSVNGATPTTIALANMVFDNSKTGHTVAQSKTDCEMSGSLSLSNLLKLVDMSSYIADLAGGVVPGDINDMKDAIANFSGDETEVGNKAISIRETFCVNKTNFSSTDICAKMNQAYIDGGGSPQTIGQQLLALLQ